MLSASLSSDMGAAWASQQQRQQSEGRTGSDPGPHSTYTTIKRGNALPVRQMQHHAAIPRAKVRFKSLPRARAQSAAGRHATVSSIPARTCQLLAHLLSVLAGMCMLLGWAGIAQLTALPAWALPPVVMAAAADAYTAANLACSAAVAGCLGCACATAALEVLGGRLVASSGGKPGEFPAAKRGRCGHSGRPTV